MIRTYQYRCLPTKGQSKDLDRMLGMTRALYNAALQERRDAWEKKGVAISYHDQDKRFTKAVDKDPDFADWKGVLTRIRRTPLKNLDLAFQAFFRRVKAGEKPGYPRFKSYNRWNSLGLMERVNLKPQNAKWHRLTFKGLRGRMRVWMHRPLPADAKIKTATLTRDSKGWRLSIALELPNVAVAEPNGSIGIDVGIKNFITTDEGEVIPNARALEKHLRKLRVEQRSLARKKRDSGNRDRQRKRVAKVHADVANIRRNMHWQAAAQLCAKGKAIAIEDLNIKGLAKSKLARQVHDVSWGQFFHRLECKAESAGVQVIRVDPKLTSQQCSGCGTIVRKSLAEREHRCDACGLTLDRDHNAAVNIKQKAVAGLPGVNVEL